MSAIVLAIAPVFLLIFLGYLFRARRLFSEQLWEPAERLTYFVLFPALLVTTLGGAETGILVELAPMAAAIAVAILVMTLLVLALRRPLRIDGPGLTSVLQGSIRVNTYLGLAVALALYGRPGLSVAAGAVAVCVPLVNLLSVAALARYGHLPTPRRGGMLRHLLGNPLILACLLGIALNLSGLGLPPIVAPLLEILGRAALPLGLLAVGASLDFGAARAGGLAVAATSGLKLVVLPGLTAVACALFGAAGIAASVAVLFMGTPAAPTSYILARQTGGDARLMSGIITVQTALALVSLPAVLAALR